MGVRFLLLLLLLCTLTRITGPVFLFKINSRGHRGACVVVGRWRCFGCCVLGLSGVQFVSTRDARTSNPFSEWLWGGMQYQLIHHLMPTMPRYHYKKVRPMVRQFAKDNGIEYRESDELPLLARNIALYRDVARAPADPNARSSSGGVSV